MKYSLKINLRDIFRLMRFYQWVKSLFIFAPLFFSFYWNVENFIKVFVGFILFNLAASGIYIFNDIKDVNEDRLHPTKKHRPIASGRISKSIAFLIMISLLTISVVLSFLLSFKFCGVVILYIILNLAYSIKLKHISILDILIVASNYVLRIVAGGILINVEISMWIILVSFTLALFLAIAKRRDDLILRTKGIKARKVIDEYNFEFLNVAMSITASLTIISYIMYTISPSVQERFGTDKLFLTSIPVIAGILRYLQLTFVMQNSGDPAKVVLKDRFLQVIILIWLTMFYLLVEVLK